MADKTRIEWTDATWNQVTGCTKVSAGCKHCYAERDWARLSAICFLAAVVEMTEPSNAPHEGPARASCAGPLDAVVGGLREDDGNATS